MRRSGLSVGFWLSLVICWTFAGCGKPNSKTSTVPAGPSATIDDDHDHGGKSGEDAGHTEEADHEHAELEVHSLAEGIAALDQNYTAVKNAYTQGAADKAHEPLHALGTLLLELPDLAKAAGLSADDRAKLQKAVDSLTDAYTKVDDAVHEGKTPDYQSVSEQIDQQMAIVRGFQSTSSQNESK